MAHTKITYHHDHSGKITHVIIERYRSGRSETTAASGTKGRFSTFPSNVDAPNCPDKYGLPSKNSNPLRSNSIKRDIGSSVHTTGTIHQGR